MTTTETPTAPQGNDLAACRDLSRCQLVREGEGQATRRNVH